MMIMMIMMPPVYAACGGAARLAVAPGSLALMAASESAVRITLPVAPARRPRRRRGAAGVAACRTQALP